LSIPSSADLPAPDASLADAGAAYSHQGLTYPRGRRAPAPGELIAIADGVGWARLPVPGSLKHINVWVLDDEDPASASGAGGVALVDTGLDLPASREAWEALLAGPVAGRRVTRILVTHFHPDHIGLAGWLAGRFGAPLWMSRPSGRGVRLLARGRLG
jgi:glyoxylase-like metal-dependent hydrolase (beta-lactamase superfamily II)